MTSGIFHSVSIDSININRENRIRRIINVEDLKTSIAALGLIEPIVVTRGHDLVAGERRLTACRQLGWTHIPSQYLDEASLDLAEDIELEENTKRSDLTWTEQHDAIMRLDAKRRSVDPAWTINKTAEVTDRGKADISRHYTVEKYKDKREVREAENFNQAYRSAKRLQEREDSDLLGMIGSKVELYTQSILTENFNDWAPIYTGPKFNLIHCDFPYGINAHQSAGQQSALEVDYTDTPETYWQLFKTLSIHLDRFCAESAHMIFWFSPNVYCATWETLKLLDGFRFDEHPLVWQRGENEGIAPDPARRPRRVYEMAFFGWRGDRKIIRTKANSVIAPTERERHPHEKSETALRHFFEMCVDGNTAIFDPTAGSGSALRAAKALGAKRWLGLELNEEYTSVARRALQG